MRRSRHMLRPPALLMLAQFFLAACVASQPTASTLPTPRPTSPGPPAATVGQSTSTPTPGVPETAPAGATGSPSTGGTASPTTRPSVTARATAATAAPSRVATGPLVEQPILVPRSSSATTLTETRALNLPAGFTIEVVAAGLGSARMLAWTPEGDLLVSDQSGRLLLLPLSGPASGPVTPLVLAKGLNQPHGLAFQGGYLYVAETTQVVRYPWQGRQPLTGKPDVIVAGLPSGGHSTRTIGFGPDGKLYLSTGSSCNSCVETDPRRAAIWQYNADGSGGRLYARGLRNAVGFVWRPGSSDLYATNNGRDNLGDDLPPETLNLVRDGADFGWPYCHNGTMPDPDPNLAKLGSCANVTRPVLEMQAHSAPLGLGFYQGAAFPAGYDGDLFIAFHGSWNRSVPTGYKVVRARFGPDGKPTGQVEDFITGWLTPSGDVWGRPVAPIAGADGALYVTDDKLGVVYRVRYRG